MDIIPEIKARFSLRDYRKNPVPADVLERILEAGRLAPSAKNRQAWRFVAIQDDEIKKRMQEACYGEDYIGLAPVLIAFCTTNIDYVMPNGQASYPIDLSFPAAFMMIQAQHEGLGSCLVSTYDEADVKQILTVPYSMRVVHLMTLGYSARDADPLRDRFPASRVISYDHW